MRFRSLAFLLLVAATLDARVVGVDVARRADLPGGYEKIVGRVRFAVRPEQPHNRAIVDLDLAPRNAAGEVEFAADVYLLRPRNGGNGSLLLEIPNRGGKGILAIMNRATGSLDPTTESEIGDGFLMNRGFTVAWLGWQWDVREEPGRMRLDVPVATDRGRRITGLLRDDFILPEPATDVPLGHQISGTLGGTEYEAADPQSRRNVLTVRDTPMGPRQTIPRSQWRFGADRRSIHLDSRFQPGRIYELVYVVRDPRVAGLGLAAVRDFVSYLKNSPEAIAPVRVAHGVGISQSGRFLRDFLYEGFNADEQGRQVFDGMIPHVAGAGRGSFNRRFAQPSRDSQPMSAILYPTDLYPFTDLPLRDPVTGREEGLLDRAVADHVAPKIFYTNTSYEYWSRAASLIHTTPDGEADAPLPDNVRIYLYTGLQHFSGPFPPARDNNPERRSLNPQSPLAVRWFWRSMLVNLDEWVKRGTPPPPSRFPHIADGTLVAREALNTPPTAGFTPPRETNMAYRVNYPDGLPIAGRPFPILIPQVDSDGNEIAGIHLPEIAAPLAVYTGWNFRDPSVGAPWARTSFLGSYLPFSNEAIASRWPSGDAYLGAFTRAALALARDRAILPADVTPILERGLEEWEDATR